jgi:hypothetical protein
LIGNVLVFASRGKHPLLTNALKFDNADCFFDKNRVTLPTIIETNIAGFRTAFLATNLPVILLSSNTCGGCLLGAGGTI